MLVYDLERMGGCTDVCDIQVLLQLLNFASVIASGLMIWKGLGLFFNTESPIVVVLRSVLSTLAYLVAHAPT